MKRPRAVIAAIRSYVPSRTLSNEQLAEEFGGWDPAKIYEKTGIEVRHIAGPDECASDLGVRAAEILFADGCCSRKDVDFLLMCTQSPDYFLPSTACLMQDRLGLNTSCGALDFNQGCSGFVYGLALAKGLVESGAARTVLLVTAETYSKFIHPRDKSVRTLFGDGAAATLVSGIESGEKLIGPLLFGTDGRGAKNLIVPAGGLRMPVSRDTAAEKVDSSGNIRSAQNLFMNGPEMFNFTIRTVPALVQELLRRAGQTIDSVDYFIFHQANRFMLEHLRKKMAIPAGRFWINMKCCGNTVSSSLPIALEAAMKEGRIRPGDCVMLVGFGVGYSWAAAMTKVIG